MSEIKNAQLYTNDKGFAQLTLVNENYEIHTVTGSYEALHNILSDYELPDLKWRHSSDFRVYVAEGTRYKGRETSDKWLELLSPYRKKARVAS